MSGSVYDLLHKMRDEKILFAYKGEINSGLLEAVYSMMEKHFEDGNVSVVKKKKFFQILVESLQNVLLHQVDSKDNDDDYSLTGFVIKYQNDSYSIITGNPVKNIDVDMLKKKLDEVNSLSQDELRTHYQQSLSHSEYSTKGGAGLGIIEMARKSGDKLGYEFTRINDSYSFFSLTITIP